MRKIFYSKLVVRKANGERHHIHMTSPRSNPIEAQMDFDARRSELAAGGYVVDEQASEILCMEIN